MTAEFPERYREALRLFNEQEFFECQEVLEELWSESTGAAKRFVQGLMQASVALFQFGNRNLSAAKKLYTSARTILETYGERFMGIELGKFLREFQACFQELLSDTEDQPDVVALRADLVPKIREVDKGIVV